MAWTWLLAAIVFEVAATLCLSASDGLRKKRWLAPVALGYAAAFLLLSLSLREGMPVAVGYGIWTAVGISAVAILARVIWKDPLTRRMLVGIALIVVGVALVRLG
ncbi:QacE family quaternary ammonium compound efflux SMR transporter [Leucobacter weissii]|uniref:QacE family quaternary ammonium compound efflux SMR transporter n=1 Tax=Leucobacter weissii TaxID=1983706 RepID=A0A939MJL0_9MICO|nr:SMR family transporter [Leucobacter weissii]MBO1901756.1 QacE family quaternary ammonium compound efflux SMR transporter [Leucobacter weissii]